MRYDVRMLAGRRDFLRLFGMATAVAAVDPAAIAHTSGDLYVNGRLSFSLVKPPGWQFLSVVDYQAARQHQLPLVDNPEVEQILRSPDSLPFVVITKFGPNYDDLNPCIAAWDEPIESDVAETDVGYHSVALSAWAKFLAHFVLLQSPHHVRLRGDVMATRSVWSYLYQHDSGREWTIRVRTLLVFRDNRTHTLHFMHGSRLPAVAEREFDAAEATVTYGGA